MPAEKWLLDTLRIDSELPYDILQELYPDVLVIPHDYRNEIIEHHYFKGNDDFAFLYVLTAYAFTSLGEQSDTMRDKQSKSLDALASKSTVSSAYLNLISGVLDNQRLLFASASDVLIAKGYIEDFRENVMDLWHGDHGGKYYNMVSISFKALALSLVMRDSDWIDTAYPYIEACAKQKASTQKFIEQLKQLIKDQITDLATR